MSPLTLLREHEREPAFGSLADNLGDSYLYARNPLYRRIRNETQLAGFTFSSQCDEQWQAYHSFPLLCMREIFNAKTIWYSNNVSGLKRFVAETPRLTLPESFILTGIKKNYLLHESAHCVAYSILSGIYGEAAQNPTKTIYRDLLGESFAVVCESLFYLAAATKTHRLFATVNSYHFYDPTYNLLLRRCVETLGAVPVVRYLLLTYLYANLLADGTRTRVFPNLISYAFDQRPRSVCKLLEALFGHAFSLNVTFREQTNRVYFRQLSLERQYLRELHTDPLSDVLRRDLISEIVDALSPLLAATVFPDR